MMAVWIALGIVAAGVLFWLWAIAPSLPRADFSAFHRFDYAHRGLHDKDKGVPENSLMAFDLAVRGGFGMEFDLQLTRDGRWWSTMTAPSPAPAGWTRTSTR